MAYITAVQDRNGNVRTIKDPEALRANANASNDNFDAAYIGTGYGTQTTSSSDAVEQTASIDNFLLLKNMPVSILFTEGITVAGASLNINSTGSKPLYYMGVALQPDVVRPRTVVTMTYDGTRYNIIAIEGLMQAVDTSLLTNAELASWFGYDITGTPAEGSAAAAIKEMLENVSSDPITEDP